MLGNHSPPVKKATIISNRPQTTSSSKKDASNSTSNPASQDGSGSSSSTSTSTSALPSLHLATDSQSYSKALQRVNQRQGVSQISQNLNRDSLDGVQYFPPTVQQMNAQSTQFITSSSSSKADRSLVGLGVKVEGSDGDRASEEKAIQPSDKRSTRSELKEPILLGPSGTSGSSDRKSPSNHQPQLPNLQIQPKPIRPSQASLLEDALEEALEDGVPSLIAPPAAAHLASPISSPSTSRPTSRASLRINSNPNQSSSPNPARVHSPLAGFEASPPTSSPKASLDSSEPIKPSLLSQLSSRSTRTSSIPVLSIFGGAITTAARNQANQSPTLLLARPEHTWHPSEFSPSAKRHSRGFSNVSRGGVDMEIEEENQQPGMESKPSMKYGDDVPDIPNFWDISLAGLNSGSPSFSPATTKKSDSEPTGFLDAVSRLRTLVGLPDGEDASTWLSNHKNQLTLALNKAETSEKEGVKRGKGTDESDLSSALPTSKLLRLQDKYDTPRLPIVLNHGLFGFRTLGPKSIPSLTLSYWRGVVDVLEANGGEFERLASLLSESLSLYT